MTRVKICGVTRVEDLETAVDAGADAVGIISDVSVDTPRKVSPERAAKLVAAAPPFVTTVLVTMPSNYARAIELVTEIEPDAIQLHGDIRPGDLAYLRAKLETQILLAVDAGDVSSAKAYDDMVDGFVVDSTGEDGGGGTGRTHDWERTRAETTDLDSPVILAGGLTPDNVSEAVRTADPFAVDVASGVEASGGVKDPDAVASFVERATDDAQTVEPGP
ncbi:phosphoribosylanthranilate isomerase [Halostagnicola sp. A-GB9-2]|uniref:phosphoribosylanthranilate isomerase n=1 Tax=Halostagnicola sp. A-GB9-2 TaxID=3048066 RepID=UPI0024BF6579|nr:phosphoribosylanthranilate isomerase [Halostagnicola sp. A-GB9-2]MDJ1431668.1 phosphoribosylanthranilate isomerase [Halostagnicola sp. A-GB9-2]